MQCQIEAGCYCKGWYDDDMWKPASKYSTSTVPLTIPALRAHWHLEEADEVTKARRRIVERTSDDVHQLVRNGGLATTVVLHGQAVDHV